MDTTVVHMALLPSDVWERSVLALIAGALGVLGVICLMAFPGAWLFALWVTPGAVLLWVAICIWSARRGKVEGAAMALVPPLLLVAVLLPNPAGSVSRWVADLVDVAMYRSALLTQVRAAPDRGGGPTIAVIGLDGFGSMTSGLAYDSSRGLDRPLEVRDPRWRAALERTELSVPGTEVRHVVGAYYSWFHP